MKKLFTLVCVLALACGATAQTTENLELKIDAYPWHYEVDPGSDINLTFTSQWGEFGLIGSSNAINPADYKGFKLTYDANPTATAGEWIQTSIGQTSGKDQYLDLDPTATELKSDFNDNIKSYESLTKFNLQAKAADQTLHLTGFYLVKEDGTEEPVTSYAGGGWGRSLGPSAAPTITFTGQYGGLEIVTTDGNSCTFSHEADKDLVYKYTVDLAAPLTNVLTIELDGASGGFAWNNFEAGTEKIEFEVSTKTAVSEETPTDVAKIYLKANGEEGFPFAVKVNKITRVVTSTSGISNTVLAPLSSANAAIYNLAGQKVDSSYKGVVIQNGKKFVQK